MPVPPVPRSLASTGPRSIERGEAGEAIPFQLLRGRASTGPRSIERGEATAPVQTANSTVGLQRGRAQLSAERSGRVRCRRAETGRLQRGRAQLSAESASFG